MISFHLTYIISAEHFGRLTNRKVQLLQTSHLPYNIFVTLPRSSRTFATKNVITYHKINYEMQFIFFAIISAPWVHATAHVSHRSDLQVQRVVTRHIFSFTICYFHSGMQLPGPSPFYETVLDLKRTHAAASLITQWIALRYSTSVYAHILDI